MSPSRAVESGVSVVSPVGLPGHGSDRTHPQVRSRPHTPQGPTDAVASRPRRSADTDEVGAHQHVVGPALVTSGTTVDGGVERGGWLLEVLLPRTDAGVAAQFGVLAVIGALLLWSTRRRPDVRFAVAPALVVVALLFGVRALH